MKHISKKNINQINDQTIFKSEPISRELQTPEKIISPSTPLKKKIDKIITIALNITCIYGAYGVVNQVADNITSIQKTKNVDKNLFNQNIFGVPYLMDVDKKPIDVVINENFSEKQKEIISNSISILDEKLIGVDYNITLDSTKANKKCITINNNIDKKNKNERDCYGVTYTKCPVFGTKIIFPVEIKLNLDEINNDYKGSIAKAKTYNQFLGAIVKHEMLHTLGLKDLYNSSENGKSIMYGHTNQYSLNDPSEQELYTINTVYPNKNDKFELPTFNTYATTIVGTPQKFTFEFLKDKNHSKQEDINNFEPEM